MGGKWKVENAGGNAPNAVLLSLALPHFEITPHVDFKTAGKFVEIKTGMGEGLEQASFGGWFRTSEAPDGS
jgi:hypothetical protein